MQVDAWLAAAKDDAVERERPELVPLLESLATSTIALRRAAADHQEAAQEPDAPPPPQR